MGLSNRGAKPHPAIFRRYGYWLLPVVIFIVCGAIGLTGEAGRDLLRYDRPAIRNGEVWRLVTGHLAHLGTSHLLLNMAGLLLVWLLVGRYLDTKRWCVAFCISVAVISSGFWFIDTTMLWYVGMSGVLHGLLMTGALIGLKHDRAESIIICLLVASKLLWEQLAGPLPGSEAVSGGTVVVNAHLYGAISGVIAAAVLWRRAEPAASI